MKADVVVHVTSGVLERQAHLHTLSLRPDALFPGTPAFTAVSVCQAELRSLTALLPNLDRRAFFAGNLFLKKVKIKIKKMNISREHGNVSGNVSREEEEEEDESESGEMEMRVWIGHPELTPEQVCLRLIYNG